MIFRTFEDYTLARWLLTFGQVFPCDSTLEKHLSALRPIHFRRNGSLIMHTPWRYSRVTLAVARNQTEGNCYMKTVFLFFSCLPTFSSAKSTSVVRWSEVRSAKIPFPKTIVRLSFSGLLRSVIISTEPCGGGFLRDTWTLSPADSINDRMITRGCDVVGRAF